MQYQFDAGTTLLEMQVGGVVCVNAILKFTDVQVGHEAFTSVEGTGDCTDLDIGRSGGTLQVARGLAGVAVDVRVSLAAFRDNTRVAAFRRTPS